MRQSRSRRGDRFNLHGGEVPVHVEEFLVSPILNDLTVFHDHDLVGVDDSRKSMSD